MQQSITEHINEHISVAMDIGEQMLISGGEISRVEDTITRICNAYGSIKTHVFTVNSGIIVTAVDGDGNTATQLRRIKTTKYNLHKLELLNQLSRDICSNQPSAKVVASKINEINKSPIYSFKLQIFVYFFVSGAFSVFFGGSIRDMIAASLTGIVMCICENYMLQLKIDSIFSTFACSLLAGLCNVILIKLGIGEHFGTISIGNIMLFIPGIAMTNSIRDMFGGDTISGTSRLFQSLTVAVMVAFGFTIAGRLI